MTKLTLSDFAQAAIKDLPQIPCRCRVEKLKEEHYTFSAENVPAVPQRLSTSALVMRNTEHRYGSNCRIDTVHFYAAGETYRQLAVLILAALFSEKSQRVVLDLEHPASSIKRLEINWSGFSGGVCWDYKRKPAQFTYHPEIPERIPWSGRLDEKDLPMFDLDFTEGSRNDPMKDLDRRDKVEIGGGDDAMILVAELLLNIGLPGCNISPDGKSTTLDNAYVLECFLGRQRVNKWSAEAQFHLPQSFSWPGDYPTLSD